MQRDQSTPWLGDVVRCVETFAADLRLNVTPFPRDCRAMRVHLDVFFSCSDATQAKKKTVDVLTAADMGVDLKPRNTVVEVTFADFLRPPVIQDLTVVQDEQTIPFYQ